MFLLDTNVVSDLRRPEKTNKGLLAWARRTPIKSLFLSAVTILELEIGMLLIRRENEAQGLMLRSWIEEQILPQFEGRILALDTAVALRCASLHVPDARSERHAIIAATALVHGMTVVTRDTVDFERTGTLLFNPGPKRRTPFKACASRTARTSAAEWAPTRRSAA